MKLNVKLLRRIQRKIAQQPKQFFMRNFVTQEPWHVPACRTDGTDAKDALPIPNCGTAACIGGWAVCLSEGIKPLALFRMGDVEINRRAQIALGLKNHQAVILFNEQAWPRKFRDPAHFGESNEPLHVRAVKRIDHFIETDGRDGGE